MVSEDYIKAGFGTDESANWRLASEGTQSWQEIQSESKFGLGTGRMSDCRAAFGTMPLAGAEVVAAGEAKAVCQGAAAAE